MFLPCLPPGGAHQPAGAGSAAMAEFCCRLPKVELHAHLNGSIRDTTIRCTSACPLPPATAPAHPASRPSCLPARAHTHTAALPSPRPPPLLPTHAPAPGRRELVHSQGSTRITEQQLQSLTSDASRTLADCFRLFDLIHQVQHLPVCRHRCPAAAAGCMTLPTPPPLAGCVSAVMCHVCRGQRWWPQLLVGRPSPHQRRWLTASACLRASATRSPPRTRSSPASPGKSWRTLRPTAARTWS